MLPVPIDAAADRPECDRAPPTSSAVATTSARPLAICWLAKETFMIASPFCRIPEEQHPKQDAEHRAASAGKRHAAEQDRGEGAQFKANSEAPRRRGVDAGDGDDPGQPRRGAADDEQQQRDASHVYAGEVGGLLADADGIDVAPAGGELEEHATCDADGSGDPNRYRYA